jgi:homocitrate synthase NifV
MIRYCDSLGVNDPFETYKRITHIRQHVSVPVELCVQNDFGMATANVLAGIRAGATSVLASIGGLGERAGSLPLEEVVMALKILHGVDLGLDTTHLADVADYVARVSRRAIPVWKALFGSSVFAYESGSHADSVLKNPARYEAFGPGAVGLTRQVIVGKHSSSRTIYHKFRNEFGIKLDDEMANALLDRVRSATMELKRPLFNKELMLLYQAETKKATG